MAENKTRDGYVPKRMGKTLQEINFIGNRMKKRGFAAMDPKKQREIASKGGKAAHLNKRAHRFTSEEAKEAGRKSAARRKIIVIEETPSGEAINVNRTS